VRLIYELDFRTCEIWRSRQDIEEAEVLTDLSGFRDGGFSQKHFIDRFADVPGLYSDPTRGIALWVSIHQERTLFGC